MVERADYIAALCLNITHAWHSSCFSLYSYCTGYEDPLYEKMASVFAKHVSSQVGIKEVSSEVNGEVISVQTVQERLQERNTLIKTSNDCLKILKGIYENTITIDLEDQRTKLLAIIRELLAPKLFQQNEEEMVFNEKGFYDNYVKPLSECLQSAKNGSSAASLFDEGTYTRLTKRLTVFPVEESSSYRAVGSILWKPCYELYLFLEAFNTYKQQVTSSILNEETNSPLSPDFTKITAALDDCEAALNLLAQRDIDQSFKSVVFGTVPNTPNENKLMQAKKQEITEIQVSVRALLKGHENVETLKAAFTEVRRVVWSSSSTPLAHEMKKLIYELVSDPCFEGFLQKVLVREG